MKDSTLAAIIEQCSTRPILANDCILFQFKDASTPSIEVHKPTTGNVPLQVVINCQPSELRWAVVDDLLRSFPDECPVTSKSIKLPTIPPEPEQGV